MPELVLLTAVGLLSIVGLVFVDGCLSTIRDQRREIEHLKAALDDWRRTVRYDRIKVPDWYRDTQVPSTAAAPMVRSTSAGDAVVHRIRVPDYGTELIPMLCDCKDGQHGTAQFSGEKSMNGSDSGQT